MKKIDFEAHFLTSEFVAALYANKGYPRFADEKEGRRLWHNSGIVQPFADGLLVPLMDLGEKRIREMDRCGVEVQLVSLAAPGVEGLDPVTGCEIARRANDTLFEVMKRCSGRIMGYAALAVRNPVVAADELERTVTELGFKGWNTHSNYGDTMLDDPAYRPILHRAEKLGVPVYLHPAVPAGAEMKGYGFALAGAPFGFGVDAALCVFRLIYSGIFDQCPGLKLILGHLGEALPFLFKRIDWAWVRPFDPKARPRLEKKPSEYLRGNVYVTTSGNYYEPAFKCTYEAMGKERILLGTDYPFEDMEESIRFVDGLPLSSEDRERIYGRNAEALGITL